MADRRITLIGSFASLTYKAATMWKKKNFHVGLDQHIFWHVSAVVENSQDSSEIS